MIANIVEILAKIAEGLNNQNSPKEILSVIDQNKNYNQNMVAAAYSWIHDKIIRDIIKEEESGYSNKSVRIFSEEEINFLGFDNYQYLMHFYYIGLLTSSDIETIITQLLLLPEGLVSLDTINLLIIALFLNIDTIQLPGSRLLLYSSDTIN